MSDIVIALGIGVIISIVLISFIVNIENAKQWLLYAVTQAEKEFGGGTGNLKLRQVYDAFLSRFPVLKLFIPFSLFANLVDESLANMEKMLEQNAEVQTYVTGTEAAASSTNEQKDEAS